MHDRDPHQVLIADHAARRIEVDPARAGDIDLDPGMGIAPGDTSSSSSPRCRYPDTNRAANPSDRSAEIMSTARSRQLPLASSRVRTGSWTPFSCRATCLKVRSDGLRHVDEKLVGVGRSVLPEERGGPAIDARDADTKRREETGETGLLFLGVGKWIGPGKALDIGGAEGRRHMVETNGALEMKLGSRLRETGGRDMIAENIPRPGDLARRWRDCELGFEHLLIVVVARTQHHPVLAERNRSLIEIGRDVSNGEIGIAVPQRRKSR